MCFVTVCFISTLLVCFSQQVCTWVPSLTCALFLSPPDCQIPCAPLLWRRAGSVGDDSVERLYLVSRRIDNIDDIIDSILIHRVNIWSISRLRKFVDIIEVPTLAEVHKGTQMWRKHYAMTITFSTTLYLFTIVIYDKSVMYTQQIIRSVIIQKQLNRIYLLWYHATGKMNEDDVCRKNKS